MSNYIEIRKGNLKANEFCDQSQVVNNLPNFTNELDQNLRRKIAPFGVRCEEEDFSLREKDEKKIFQTCRMKKKIAPASEWDKNTNKLPEEW
ncbi:hypothetical protein CEXT_680171 [Caerostris extrusa]|uniref:Uncharacterized protein n=1 Tax=Caerostris extrusa TaxID=172846 RepID=A0AAV4M5G4_CAEEX|nr:hypothetical protein CEXT_680171 [Caerostris extrusa]